MASSNEKYSLVFGCNREAWLHGKPKVDSIGNVQSLEVIYSPFIFQRLSLLFSKSY